MENIIEVNFKNILSEMDSKQFKLCFLKGRGLFIEDNQRNLYAMETYRVGSYLDNLISRGITVEFHQVENSENIGEWEKEVWNTQEVENFIERHVYVQ